MSLTASVVVAAFGATFGGLLRKAAEKHVERFFGSALARLTKPQRDATTVAMVQAFGACLDLLLRQMESLAALEREELEAYRASFERLGRGRRAHAVRLLRC